MKISKFSWDKVKLSSLQCHILKILLEEDFPHNYRSLSKKTKAGISGISKALKELSSLGLIGLFKEDVLSCIINPYRKRETKNFITGWDLGKNKPIILSGHAFTYISILNSLPEKFLKYLEKDSSFIGYSPNGWKAFRKFLPDGSFKLHKTKKSSKIIMYFKTFGFNPDIIEQINHDKFWSLKQDLEEAYPGLKIGNVERIAQCPWQEYALQKDPVAIAGIALGIKHKCIEQSYGYPEWEEKGFNARDKIQKIIDLREKETLDLE